jgi:lipid II:glycine glycyltransferase (peptidoglycan interpeptide bridge formation enzyme)
LLSEPVAQYEGLLQAALDLARERRWRFIEFRVPGSGFPGKPAYCRYHGHGLDLTPAEDSLFESFSSSTRRGIRKAEQSWLDLEVSRERAALRHYYDLHCDTRQRQGVPPQAWRFFRAIHEHLLEHNQGFVVLARKNDRPVAGSVFLHFNGRAVYKFGASDFRLQHLRANNLVMWQGIRHCRNIGCRHLDFGRTDHENEGLRRFKQGWGTREFPITYHRYSTDLNKFLESTRKGSGWLNAIFKHVPVPLARLVGALLYRYAA